MVSNKNRKVIGIFILAVIVCSVAGYMIYKQTLTSEEKTITVVTDEGPITVVLKCPLPSLPRQIPHLKIVNRSITAEQARTIAEEVFNLTGTVRRWNHAYEVTKAGTDTFILYDLGGFVWRAYYYGPHVAPLEENAERVAERFVEKLKDKELTPRHPLIEIEEGRVTESSVGDTVEIVFNLKFKGIVMGEIKVNVGEGGVIAGVLGDWREVTPEGNISLMTVEEERKLLPEKLIQELNRELSRYSVSRSSYPYIKKVTVEDITLEYFSGGLTEFQDHLLPIYLFDFKLEWEGKNVDLVYGPEVTYCSALSATDGEYIYGLSLTGIS